MRPTLIKRKLIAGLAFAIGAAVLALGSLTAGASAAPNPDGLYGAQGTNVPYVAWVGEHVRLVACEPSFTEDVKLQAIKHNADPQSILGSFFNDNFEVEDWSGYQFQPPTADGSAGSEIGQPFDPGPSSFFESSEGKDCIATDYKSLNPGLTRIRAVVKNDEDGEIVFSHQFLVIWLTVNKPVLHEAATSALGTETFQSELSGTGQSNLSNFLGDKEGNGLFVPSPFSGEESDKGLVQIKVTGSFPVLKEAPLHNILEEEKYTLPEAWPTLAKALASSSEETEPPGTNPGLWDIHGTPSFGDGYNASSPSALFAAFSSDALSGGFTSGETATVGPYDPQSADETLVSDGTLDADDAPMPAMRIDVSLAAHDGGLSGVGEISGASKALIYSHNFNGDAEEAGNLYNPYYGAYIPATDRGLPQSSGVTGPSPGGDFPGFLNNHSEPYTFWTSVLNANYRGESHSTGCLRREGAEPSEYETPSDVPQTETFYTDERGEVYVTYTPGDGFYLENLPELHAGEEEKVGEIIKNNDGGCDLRLLKGQEIGNSVISARAVYPYEPVDYSAQASENTLTKTVTSEWEKEWFQFSKGPGSNENTVKIIVAKAQDIDGKPFVGEAVCFVTPNGGTVSQFPGKTVYDENGLLGLGKGATVEVGPSTIVHPAGKEGKLCETTNSHGLVAIEVTNSTLKHVDLNVEYVEENILRDHEVSFVTPAEEKAEKEAAEKAAKEKAKEKAAKEAAEEKARHEAAEKKAEEERLKEVAEKKITEKEATEKAAAEKAANEAAEIAANEQRAKEVEAAKKAAGTSAVVTTTNTSGAAPLYTPIGGTLGVSSSVKPLTAAQKLANALKACKKLSKSKRAACEAKAKRAYSAKKKKK
jgi:flagellar biosynthesis GTPase FlhF